MHLTRVPAALALLIVPFMVGSPCTPTPVVHEVPFGGLTLRYWQVGQERVGRTAFEFVFQAELVNESGLDATQATAVATLDPSDPNGIVSGALSFGPLPDGTTAGAPEPLAIRVDRTQPFDPGAIAWSFDAVELEVDAMLDPARSATALVTEAGGSVGTITEAGVEITLAFPEGALAAPTSITLTPVVDVSSPVLIGFELGVLVEPDGVELLAPVTLTFDPAPVDLGVVAVFAARGDGTALRLIPAEVVGTALVVETTHLTTYGAAEPTAPPCQDVDCDDNDVCTRDTCDPATGECMRERTPCDDGNACTTDVCDVEGGCFFIPIDCDDGDGCTVDTCDPVTGACSNPPLQCNDGNVCTGDVCDPVAGACVNEPIECSDGDACTIDVCDGQSGCFFAPLSCDDDDECTVDTCDSETGCVNQSVCDDGNECTIDSCDGQGGCVNTPVGDGVGCEDDGNACTTDVCLSGTCVHPDRECPGDECNRGICDPELGCDTEPQAGNSCTDDGDECTDDICLLDDLVPDAAFCAHTPKTCFDGNDCTEDTCDPTLGCTNPPKTDGAGCADDGNLCTTDVCLSGACVHPDRECPGNDCNQAICNPMDGCDTIPLAGSSCTDDGSVCTEDVCVTDPDGPFPNQAFCAHEPIDCEMDAPECQQVLGCHPETGCFLGDLADGTPCGGEDLCLDEVCQSGACVAIDEVQCGAGGDPCAGQCNPTTGQCEIPAAGTSCSGYFVGEIPGGLPPDSCIAAECGFGGCVPSSLCPFGPSEPGCICNCVTPGSPACGGP